MRCNACGHLKRARRPVIPPCATVTSSWCPPLQIRFPADRKARCERVPCIHFIVKEQLVRECRRKVSWFGLTALVLLTLGVSHAQFSVDVHFGTSGKFVTTLDIRQAGFPDVTIRDVHYETRSWNPDTSLLQLTENYYSLRVGYMFGQAVENRPGF